MNEAELDLLLSEARADVPAHLANSATQTSRAVAAHAGRRRRRRRWALPVGVTLSVAALTAAAPYVVPGMDRWPYVGINEGDRRADARIPVVYAGPGGPDSRSCGAWMDVANASDAEMARLNRAIEHHRWPRLTYGGQGDEPGGSPDDLISLTLKHFITHDVPGIGWGWDHEADTAAFQVTAWGVECELASTDAK